MRFFGIPVHTVFFLWVAASIFTACEHESRGIYANIEEEVRVTSSSDGEFGYSTAMVRTTVNDAERYYLTATQMFWRLRDDDGEDWNTINLPSAYSIANNVQTISVENESLILVSLLSSSNARSGLFELRPGSGNAHLWEENVYRDSEGERLDEQITSLYVLGAEDSAHLFVLSRSSDSASHTLRLYHTNGTADTADDRLHVVWDTVGQIIDGDHITSAGTDFLIFSDRTGLYCVSDSNAGGAGSTDFTPIDGNSVRSGLNQFEMRSLVVDTGEDPDSDAAGVGGILVQDNTIYVSSEDGEVYRYREVSGDATAGNICGADWSGSCADNDDSGCWEKSSYGEGSYRYSDMAWYNQQGAARGILIGVVDNGRREGGYREIALSDSISTLASLSEIDNPSGNNYRSTALSSTTAHSFFIDGNTIFALTYGRGLWRGTYANGTPTWSWDLSR